MPSPTTSAPAVPTRRLTSENLHDPVLPYVNPLAVKLRDTESIEEARSSARQQAGGNDLSYLYVVDSDDVLVGVVPLRQLIVADPAEQVRSIMLHDVIAIPSWATVLVACEYFVNRRLQAFPVIEDSGRLIGVVDVSSFTEEMVRIARQSFDDMFQLVGIHAVHDGGTWTGFLDRFPWLLCNIGGGVLAAVLVGHYEPLMDHAIVLALFIPVVLALSESISVQSVTLTIQSLHTDQFRWPVFLRSVRRECGTALLLGLACGATMTVIAGVWKGQPLMAAAMGAAIAASMVTAALIGLALPTLLHALRANPRIASGPIVLASADTVTLLFYFTLAGWVVR